MSNDTNLMGLAVAALSVANKASVYADAAEDSKDDAAAAADRAEAAAEAADGSAGALIADAFSTSTAYAVGDYVVHSGALYRFTSAHSAGAWDASDVVEDTVCDELADVKSAITHINNDQSDVKYSDTISGTGMATETITEIPAGTYTLYIEKVTTTDTDYQKTVISFYNGNSQVLLFKATRNVEITQEITFDSAVNKIVIYASESSTASTGDTFTVKNMMILAESALGKRISDLETDVSAVESQISGQSGTVQKLNLLVTENAEAYTDGWSQGYWTSPTETWSNNNICRNTVAISLPANATLKITPNSQYVLLQDGTGTSLANMNALFDGESKNASVSYQTATLVVVAPRTEDRKIYMRVAANSGASAAITPMEVTVTVKIQFADETKEKADIGTYNLNKTTLEDGGLNYTNGTEEVTANVYRTGFIPVEADEIYEIYSNYDDSNDVQYIFEYTDNKTFIKYNTSLANKSWWQMSSTTAFVRVRTASPSSSYTKRDKDKLIIVVDKWYRRNTFNDDALLKGHDFFSVTARQADVLPNVYASAGYGLHNNGVKNYRKVFSMMLTTDVHYCASALLAAINYMNATPSIDCGICIGDIQSGNFGQNPSDWYTHAVGKSQKPFFTVIGNHDGGEGTALATAGSTQAVFETFVEPTLDKIGIPDLETCYYAKTFTDHGIVLIVLNDFDLPDTLADSSNYLVPRNTYDFVSQAQVDWLISTLNNVPNGYHVMIARHDSPSAATSVDCVWTQPGMTAEGCGAIYSGEIVPDIVNAWINGTSLSETYSPSSGFSSLGDITVDADFSSRGVGVFIGYIQGHTHTDVYAHDTKYPDQNVFVVTTSANDLYQGFRSDLPRVRGTKTDECFTVLSVDKANRAVNVVRVGSCITSEMTNRVMYRFTY